MPDYEVTVEETNEQLCQRYKFVKERLTAVEERLAKAQRRRVPASQCTRLAQRGGQLTFALLQIESEMRERGLLKE